MVGRHHSNVCHFSVLPYKYVHHSLGKKVVFPMRMSALFPGETKMHPFFNGIFLSAGVWCGDLGTRLTQPWGSLSVDFLNCKIFVVHNEM